MGSIKPVAGTPFLKMGTRGCGDDGEWSCSFVLDLIPRGHTRTQTLTPVGGGGGGGRPGEGPGYPTTHPSK